MINMHGKGGGEGAPLMVRQSVNNQGRSPAAGRDPRPWSDDR